VGVALSWCCHAFLLPAPSSHISILSNEISFVSELPVVPEKFDENWLENLPIP